MTQDIQPEYSELCALLRSVKGLGGSDIILSAGVAPHAKVFGQICELSQTPLTAEWMEAVVASLMTGENLDRFREQRSLDLRVSFSGFGSVRFNFYNQQGSPALVGRLIAETPPDIDALGLPPSSLPLLNHRSGLILVTGPAGSGKSTTLAAAIHHFNQTRRYHIISIEDPAEYRHPHLLSVVEQVEIDIDAHTFSDALRASLRQAPDVIVIGELRDPVSMEIALTHAEAGHLVLATVHSRDAIQAITRIVDAFPAGQQSQAYSSLSQVLLGVIAQQLIPDTEGKKMILATEILLACQAIRNLIRERKVDQIYSVLQSSGNDGMITMNDALFRLVQRGLIHAEEALTRATRPVELARLLNGKHSSKL